MQGSLIEAEAVAGTLHDTYYEAMMEQGEALDFNTVRVPGSGYVQIRIEEFPLWDSEDDNDGESQTFPVILAYCEKRLKDYADLFSAFKTK